MSLFVRNQFSKRLLNKLCKGCTFLADGRLIRQVDGCPMDGRFQLFSRIYFVYDVVKPLRPKIYFMLMMFIVNGSRINLINFSIN